MRLRLIAACASAIACLSRPDETTYENDAPGARFEDDFALAHLSAG
jgi:hypothetical protein